MIFRTGEKTSDGYLALPPTGAGPGILVLHAWWGLNDFFTGLCDRLAAEGYVALAPDLFHGQVATSIEEAERLTDVHDADAERNQARVLEALDALRDHPAVQGRVGDKVAVLGCSLGVWWAVQLAAMRPDTVGAAVLFYGAVDADFAASRCAYLGHFAENDEFEPLEAVRNMVAAIRAAGREVDFHVYPGVGHWFIESDRPDAYNAEASALAWDRTLSFLARHLNQNT